MIAGVILNNQEANIDKIFDYKIPSELEDYVKIGSRVTVPFGRKNSPSDGVVIDIYEKSDCKRLKSIIKLDSEYPICTKELLKLAEWMKEKYFCSLFQALRPIMPPSTKTKKQRWIALSEKAEEYQPESIREKKIIEFLSENNCIAEYNEIYDFIQAGIADVLKKLEENGIISIYDKLDKIKKAKQVRVARLLVSADEAVCIAGELEKKRITIQARIMNVMAECKEIYTADLMLRSSGNYSALNALVKKGYLEIENKEIVREAYDELSYKKSAAYVPTDEQRVIIDYLNNKIEENEFDKVLVRGVTGSGKTEVFLQVIERCIELGKNAIMLVPEISLTPQMVERFVSRFGKSVAVIHSRLSNGERFDQWRKIYDGEVKVVVGARSAVFAPFENIGIIILDEEHENSYKSETTPKYHARDIAFKRAVENNSVVLLASATPLVESYSKALDGEYKLFEMEKRYNDMKLPEVKIVDMRSELLDKKNFSPISITLQMEIAKNLENGEKTILFLNRRGFSTFVSCRDCGHVMMCENCDIALTYHKRYEKLICHYCGYNIDNVTVCPECGSSRVKFFGTGTQKIEEALSELFPSAKILRMDADTTSQKGGHEKILKTFSNGGADILLGTQMVTKGLDFPSVTLVGVLAADSSLGIDDFRASERTFSQLTQVCGRAGRGDRAGRAVIQTYQPQNATIGYASHHNYINFFENEILNRKRLNYPPFCDIICLVVMGENADEALMTVNVLGEIIKEVIKVSELDAVMLGPVAAPVSRIKNMFRYRILIKNKCEENTNYIVNKIIDEHKNINNKTVINIDVNPINMT